MTKTDAPEAATIPSSVEEVRLSLTLVQMPMMIDSLRVLTLKNTF